MHSENFGIIILFTIYFVWTKNWDTGVQFGHYFFAVLQFDFSDIKKIKESVNMLYVKIPCKDHFLGQNYFSIIFELTFTYKT